MTEISELQRQISNYSRTLNVYRAYRDSKWSKKYHDAHEGDIILHKAAKKHFDSRSEKAADDEYAETGVCHSPPRTKSSTQQKQARAKMIEILRNC